MCLRTVLSSKMVRMRGSAGEERVSAPEHVDINLTYPMHTLARAVLFTTAVFPPYQKNIYDDHVHGTSPIISSIRNTSPLNTPCLLNFFLVPPTLHAARLRGHHGALGGGGMCGSCAERPHQLQRGQCQVRQGEINVVCYIVARLPLSTSVARLQGNIRHLRLYAVAVEAGTSTSHAVVIAMPYTCIHVGHTLSRARVNHCAHTCACYLSFHCRVCKILGSGVTETRVINGIVVKRAAEGNISSVENAKVAVFACALDIGKTETKGMQRAGAVGS